ncbi:MAG: RDD family protein [Candidatus Eisenbacteria bacterium]|uniref:RDD family protein n=1 Tax=Eiseniibacteriota bacterium TaxID=2212470 RepID=A0A9D6L720_UNCEI|nr:RDD family protein [Candidatus Eisenbacteria bacterium]MBI3539966.1 RDD family protein [Candidatus Eisenbacteria bacterium]
MYCWQCGAEAATGASFCSRCGAALRNAAAAVAGAFATDAMTATALRAVAAIPATAQTATRYAGFWRRLAACLVDSLLFAIVSGLVNVVMGVSVVDPDYTEGRTWKALAINTVIAWIYSAAFESSRAQGTLGQQALGIAVTDLAGGRISFARATGRHFGQLVSALLLFVGYVMIAFTEKKQALHDMMAGCLLVRRSDPL